MRILTYCLPILLFLVTACGEKSIPRPSPGSRISDPPETTGDRLPAIDLSNWKVTLPVGNPTEVKPPEILDYPNVEVLMPYMYPDTEDQSIVFFCTVGASTANSSYSRTELREQMVPGSNSTNWTFAEGGRMKGKLAVTDISLKPNGDPYRTIIMQIHGRLTNEQRDLIGEDDNNAPPILKIYWDRGKIRVKSKELIDLNASYEEMLRTSAWGDDEGYNFPTLVNNEPFTLEIIAEEEGITIVLNESEEYEIKNIHMGKWGIFENYFKAGNYFQSRDEESSATVKYYQLEVSH